MTPSVDLTVTVWSQSELQREHLHVSCWLLVVASICLPSRPPRLMVAALMWSVGLGADAFDAARRGEVFKAAPAAGRSPGHRALRNSVR